MQDGARRRMKNSRFYRHGTGICGFRLYFREYGHYDVFRKTRLGQSSAGGERGTMKIRMLLSAVVAVFALTLTGCGEKPDDVVKNWHAALMNGDLEKANQYADAGAAKGNAVIVALVKDLKMRAASDQSAQTALKKLEGMTFSKSEVSGDTAVVRASLEGENKDGILTLKKIGGKWVLSDLK